MKSVSTPRRMNHFRDRMGALKPQPADQETPTDEERRPLPGNLYELVVRMGCFGRFGYALRRTGLARMLRVERGLTLFVPTDIALSAFAHEHPTGMLDNADSLKALVAQHISRADGPLADRDKMTLKSIGGQNLNICLENGQYFVNGLPLLRVNLGAGNGVLHIVNGVLAPDHWD